VLIGPGPDGPETEFIVAVPEGAKITRGDKAVALDELKEGERVTVTAEKRNGKLTASAIQVGGEAAPVQPPSRLEKVRRILQTVDRVLEMAEQMRRNGPKP
jgi:hypothetical protein